MFSIVVQVKSEDFGVKSVKVKEEYFEDATDEIKKENIKGEEKGDVKKEIMTELEKVKEENQVLKKENAKLILRLKNCGCKSEIKPDEGTKVIKVVGEGNVNEPGEVGEEGEGRGEDLENEVGEGNAEVVKVKPVKRKLRGKNTKVHYNEELSEDNDDPDFSVGDEPNYSGQSCKM